MFRSQVGRCGCLHLFSPAGVFGQRLEETVLYERRYGVRVVPIVVEQCVNFIRERGLEEVGLFRQPGRNSLVRELQEAFDSGERPSFDRFGQLWLFQMHSDHIVAEDLHYCAFPMQYHRCPLSGITAEALSQTAARTFGSLQLLPELPLLRSEAVE